ncbi:MAG: hypothetical protein C0459_01840 [Chitinophaga sp.]|jgi:PAS domain S-box-containing protein|nr:hypothetical protein [Chitinophaga sp.]
MSKNENNNGLAITPALFQNYIHNIKQYGIVTLDNSGIITSFNKGAEIIKGYKEEEVLGKHYSIFYTEESIKKNEPDNNLKKALETGLYESEGWRVRKDKSIFWASVSYDVLYDNAKKHVGYVKVVKDATESETVKQQLKETLNNQAAILEKIFERITDAFIALDKDFRYTYINKKAQQLIRKSAEEVLGKCVWDIFPDAVGSATYDAFLQAMKTQEFVQHTDYYEPLNLTQENYIYPSPEGLSVFIKDISERKIAEEKIKERDKQLRFFIKHSPVALAMFDKKMNYIMTSDRWITDFKLPENIIGKNHYDIFPEIPDYWKDIHKKCLKGEVQKNDEEAFVRADGTIEWLRWEVHPWYNTNEEVGGIIIFSETITDRVTAKERISLLNEKVSNSEKQYRYLFDNNPMPLLAMDINSYEYLDVNDAALKQYGYTKKEFLKLTAKDIRPKEDVDKFINQDHSPSIYKRGIWRHMRKDGSLFYAEITTQNIFFNGRNARLVLVNDITEKLKAEEGLKKSLRETSDYKKALDASAIVSISNADEYIVYVNDNFCKVSKYSREELIGKEHSIINSGYHSKEFMIKLSNTIRSGKIFQSEFRNKAKDGSFYWVFNTIVPFVDENNKPYQYVAIATDITKRKEAELISQKNEKIYQTIASSIPGSLVALLSIDNTYTFAEGDLIEKLGFTKEAIIGKTPKEILTEEQYNFYNPLLEAAFKGKTIAFDLDRLDYSLIVKLVPLKDESDYVYSFLIFYLDVTELKKTQKAIEELNEGLEIKVAERTEQLENVNKELEAFSYSVSHDLRAPLRIIDGYSEILLEEYERVINEEGKRLINVIRTNTKRMGVLIDELLNLSRLGKKEMKIADINMESLINSSIKELLPDASPKINIQIGTIENAACDAILIRQVWINLLSNAIKYSSKKEKQEIFISSYINDNNVVYTVKDNGAGFNMQYVNKLFGVFQRLHKVSDFEGTGIGLALVKRIIHKHGGNIWAESELDKGAIFYFSLPLNIT